MSQYGFFELEKVKTLSEQSRVSIIEKIAESGLPYAIAMFDYLQFIERLWRTVKQDYIYLSPIETGLELYQGLKKFFEHYNHFKAHQGIGRVPPATLYKPVA